MAAPRRGGHDDAARTQTCQLLRDNRLIDAEPPPQILHAAPGSDDEHFQQANARRVGERSEELGLQGLEFRNGGLNVVYAAGTVG